MKLKLSLLTLLILISTIGFSQTKPIRQLGSRTNIIHIPGIVQVDSAVLFPKDTIKLKSTDRALAYKTDSWYSWNGVNWAKLSSSSSSSYHLPYIGDSTKYLGGDTLYHTIQKAWLPTGNIGTDSTNFIGNIDNKTLYFRVNNLPSGSIGSTVSANVSLGVNTIPLSSTGVKNTAMGAATLKYNTDGYNNTALGYSSLYYNTRGHDNTIVGWSAMPYVDSAVGNSSLGWASLGQSTSHTVRHNARFNTALGYYTLANNFENYYNIGIGFQAGMGDGTTGQPLNNTLFISDSTSHMYYKLDSAVGTAPSVIGKDANGYWHTYQTPAGGGGGSTPSLQAVTNIGYNITNPIVVSSNYIQVNNMVGGYHSVSLGYDPYSGSIGFSNISNYSATISNKNSDSSYTIDLPILHIPTSSRATFLNSVNNIASDIYGNVNTINDATSTTNSTYSSSKINSLISSAGGGDMLSSVYDPTGKNTDVFNYNNLYNKPAAYTLPTASSTVLGGIKVGSGLTIASGVLSATGGTGSTTNAVTFNTSGLGAASGTTFDGSVARTISYNTIGALPSTFRDTTNYASPVTYNSTTKVVSLDSTITSGTYVPTFANISNVSSAIVRQCQYMRVLNVVTVSGVITTVKPTSAGISTFSLSLPIPSTFTASYEAGGTGGGISNGTYYPFVISAGSGTNTVAVSFVGDATIVTLGSDCQFSFTYLVH